MAMRSNDNSRCNCEKIFTKETLNCCCDTTEKNCNCELNDYKCCLKTSSITCCGEKNKNSDKKCLCNDKKSGTDKQSNGTDKQSLNNTKKSCSNYNIRRIESTLKCCCEINGTSACCCSKILDKSCCCIVTGKDECCCEHSRYDAKNSENNKSQESIKHSRVIEKTSVHGDLSMQSCSKTVHSMMKSSQHESTQHEATQHESTQHESTQHESTQHNKNKSINNTVHIENPSVAQIKTVDTSKINTNQKSMNDYDPSFLTSACLASQRNKEDYKSVDKDLLDELKEFKKTCLSQETYDVYIVNDKGNVNSFELKHFANHDESTDSNPNEEFLNRQIHGICIKNKQAGLNNTYESKAKSILDKIKKQSFTESNKQIEPTILEISEFTPRDKNKTNEIIQNVFKSECNCDRKNKVCKCNIKLEMNGVKSEPIRMNFTDLKTYSQDNEADADKENEEDKENKNNNYEVNENEEDKENTNNKCEINEEDADKENTNVSVSHGKSEKNKLYYSTNSSTESDSITIGDEIENDKEESHETDSIITSPFETDMNNKIKNDLEAQNIRPDTAIDSININIGGRILLPDENGLEVTSFKMNIDGVEESIDIENDTPSDEIIDKIMQNPAVTIKKTPKNKSLSTSKSSSKEIIKAETFDMPPQEKTISVMNSKVVDTKIEKIIENLANKKTSEEDDANGKKDEGKEEDGTNGKKDDSKKDETKVNTNEQKDDETKVNTNEGTNKSTSNTIQSLITNRSTKTYSNGTDTSENQVKRKQLSNEEKNITTKIINEDKNTSTEDKNTSTEDKNTSTEDKNTTNANLQFNEETKESSNPKSLVSCLAKAKAVGSTVEIALHLTNEEEKDEDITTSDSTITFIEQDTSDLSSTLAQVKRNNKVGKLIEYFEKKTKNEKTKNEKE